MVRQMRLDQDFASPTATDPRLRTKATSCPPRQVDLHIDRAAFLLEQAPMPCCIWCRARHDAWHACGVPRAGTEGPSGTAWRGTARRSARRRRVNRRVRPAPPAAGPAPRRRRRTRTAPSATPPPRSSATVARTKTTPVTAWFVIEPWCCTKPEFVQRGPAPGSPLDRCRPSSMDCEPDLSRAHGCARWGLNATRGGRAASLSEDGVRSPKQGQDKENPKCFPNRTEYGHGVIPAWTKSVHCKVLTPSVAAPTRAAPPTRPRDTSITFRKTTITVGALLALGLSIGTAEEAAAGACGQAVGYRGEPPRSDDDAPRPLWSRTHDES
jgi:hypothetical protein